MREGTRDAPRRRMPQGNGKHGPREEDRAREREVQREPIERPPRSARSTRGAYEDDRDEGYHSIEHYGMGQSGYTSGRYGDDPSLDIQTRNQTYVGGYEDRSYGLGVDDRFSGRGGQGYWQGGYERPTSWTGREGFGQLGEGPEYHGDRDPGGYHGGYHGGYTGGYRGRYEEHGGSGGFGAQGPGPGHTGGYARGHRPWGEPWGEPWVEPWVDRGPGNAGGYHDRDSAPGGHRGKGPRGYERSDERIRELVCELLTDDDAVDASHVEVSVKHGEVTLAGTVPERRMKRRAEDCAERVGGVKDVHNQLTLTASGNRDTSDAVRAEEPDKRSR